MEPPRNPGRFKLAGALTYAEVQIVAVSDTRAAVLPPGMVTVVGDRAVEVDGQMVISAANLPPEGILWMAEDE